MLRISIADGIVERRWVIQGRLVEPWVSELEEAWETSCHERDQRRCVVDLADMTAVDERGEKVLRAMRESGAVFVGCGLYASQLVADIDRHRKARLPMHRVNSLKTTTQRK
jgi:hypothetical protein